MKKKNKFMMIFLLIAILIVTGAMLLKKRKQSIKDAPTPIVMTHNVEVVLPVNQHIKQTRSFLAKLAAKDIARISSKFSGRINEISVRENQSVKKGDILVLIDDYEIRSKIKALTATKTAQKKEVKYTASLYSRNKTLFKAGGLAKEKLDESEVHYLNKKAVLENTIQKIIETKVQLSYLTIEAPFDGIVGTIYLQKGSLATPGNPVITINSYGQKLIFNYVPKALEITIGKTVIMNDKVIGKVSELYNDAEKGLLVAEISLDKYLDKPNGSYLNINVVTLEGSGCTVPVNALLHNKNKTEIMVFNDQHFKPMTVTITAQNKKFALIEPCSAFPVAVGSESKLGQLPVYEKINVQQGVKDE